MFHRATPETYILSDLTFPRVIAFVKILHADFSSILATQSHSKLGDELYRQFEHLVKLIEETKVAMEEEAKLAESQKVPEKKRVDLRRKVWGRRWTILEDLAKDIDDELMGREGREVEEALKRSQISS